MTRDWGGENKMIWKQDESAAAVAAVEEVDSGISQILPASLLFFPCF